LIVVNTQPFALVFTLVEHAQLGLMLEPHVVQQNHKGMFTLTHQRVFSKTADYFSKNIAEEELEIIQLLDEVDDDFLFRKFNTETKKKIRTAEFFNKLCSVQLLEEKIKPYVQTKMNKVFERLRGKHIYKTGNDNNPISQKIFIAEEPAQVLFHFKQNEDGIRYYPTIKYQSEKIEFMYKGAVLVGLYPAWLMVNNNLYSFAKNLEGKKLQPFLNKRYILIPKNAEENHLQKFVSRLVEKYDVKSDCFGIQTIKVNPKAKLQMVHFYEEEIALKLQFAYQDAIFDYDSDQKIIAHLKKEKGHYLFDRIVRDIDSERKIADQLVQLGLQYSQSAFFKLPQSKVHKMKDVLLGTEVTNKYIFLDWLSEKHADLDELGISINQEEEAHKYYFGPREIKIEVKEQRDWFDVSAIVQFGEYTFSFLTLKEYILKGKREFILPNGMLAIIPEEWFGNLTGILEFSSSEDEIKLEKQHVGLLEEIANQGGKYLNLSDKLLKLKDGGTVPETDAPLNFKGELRPYQKAGLDWFYFLKSNQFGGCLADDMGLGKTIQTLSLLQKEKEFYQQETQGNLLEQTEVVEEPIKTNGNAVQMDLFAAVNENQNRTHFLQTGGILSQKESSVIINERKQTCIRCSLIIVPNSLVFNWYQEALKFTPELKILVYTGVNRVKRSAQFANYDLVISTYGTIRVDIEIIKEFKFNYLILDESQAIKNPNSQSSKAVKMLRASNKLVLTGTPIENSVQELWSQLSFVNPGLLGGLNSFTERFVIPIEKQKDTRKLQQLKAIIKPFILRRTKDQVAKDLPAKMEQLVYCQMSDEQKEAYEKVKSHYRNEILNAIKELGLNKSQFTLLQGLTKLRQIANHPLLVNSDFEGISGKFKEVTYMAETAMSEGHKVLIFSQFVSQLAIYRNWLNEKGIAHCYLDGSMSNDERQKMVNSFQNGQIPFFLISLKAGGFGLNLTQADYVFMLDPWWNPAVERQAIDRAHRIGQDKPVFIYKFISKETVEEKILLLQQKKTELANSLIETDEAVIKQIDIDEILALLD